MPRPVATRITIALGDLLAACTAENGYPSDVGRSVFLGQIQGRADDAPAIWLIPGAQKRRPVYDNVREVVREYSVRAFSDLRSVAGWADATAAERRLIEVELVDQVIADVRRCLDTWEAASAELPSLISHLGETADKPGYSDDGGTRVGAGVDFTVTYWVDPADPTTPA